MPSVSVRVYVRRSGEDASALNHWVAPATFVSVRAVLRVGVELGLVADAQPLVGADGAGRARRWRGSSRRWARP